MLSQVLNGKRTAQPEVLDSIGDAAQMVRDAMGETKFNQRLEEYRSIIADGNARALEALPKVVYSKSKKPGWIGVLDNEGKEVFISPGTAKDIGLI